MKIDIDGSYYYRLGHLYAKVGDRPAAAEALHESGRLRRSAEAASQFQKTP
ncbi:MAG: hypothetical protein JST28_21150 [Acidobacteria bacterium]|nr:hypothetical protein [Acidobacteriota bacterium]